MIVECPCVATGVDFLNAEKDLNHAATSWKQKQETFNAIHHNYTYSTMQEKAVNDQSATEGKYLVLNDPINILPHK